MAAPWVLLLLGWLPLAAGAVEIRPFSEAERAAARTASIYLAGGAEALVQELAVASPWADLAEAEQIAELEVRLGPPAAAEWALLTPTDAIPAGRAGFAVVYPSGFRDVIELEMAEEDGGWRLARVVSAVEVREPPDFLRDLYAGEDEEAAAAVVGSGMVAAAIAVLLMGLGSHYRTRVPQPALIALAGLLLLVACRGPGQPDAPSEASEAGSEPEVVARLGALRDYRWHLLQTGQAQPGEVPPDPELTATTRVWEAERQLIHMALEKAQEELAGFDHPTFRPAVAALRATLHQVRGAQEEALAANAQVRRLGLAYDSNVADLINVQAGFGGVQMASASVRYLREIGSRDAWSHYAAARLALIDGQEEEALRAFRDGWELGPIGRAELFADPTLTALVTKPELFGLLGLDERPEPRVVVDEIGANPIDWPASAEASLHGRLLDLVLGDASLAIPGGAELVPLGTPPLAGGLARKMAARTLTWLTETGRSDTPVEAVVHKAERAVLALLEAERWQEIIDVTDRMGVGGGRGSATLIWFRALALDRVGRKAAAKSHLVEVANRNIAEGHLDPALLGQLSELLAQSGEYELAIKLTRRIARFYPVGALDYRIRQLALDLRLEQGYLKFASNSFDIRYPRLTGESYASDIAGVLESERDRLKKWIPARAGDRIEVNLFPLEEFMTSFGQGGWVIGLFDGRVRVPFADLYSLHPSLVATLSHELAHAMIDARTDGKAPKWFHEGLAQHVQMADQPINALAELAESQRMLALPALEAILAGMSNPKFITAAYNQAAWMVHFVEARGGRGALDGMMRVFAAGGDTDEAIRSVFKVEPADFERDFWQWGTTRAPRIWPTESRRYDKERRMVRTFGKKAPSRQESGQARPRTPRAQVDPALKTRMVQWYRGYAREAAPIKRDLGVVIRMLKGSQAGHLGSACQALERTLASKLANPSFLRSPEPKLNSALKLAFDEFRHAGKACARGAMQGARDRISRGEKHLATAGRLLSPFGLQP